jgi:hypothetical protein
MEISLQNRKDGIEREIIINQKRNLHLSRVLGALPQNIFGFLSSLFWATWV